MRILKLQNILREEGHIFYMRKFTAEAVIEVPNNTFEVPIEFNIETSPFGARTIEIKISNSMNYPFLPVRNALREFILAEDIEGKLPC